MKTEQTPKNILVIDDEKTILISLKKALNKAGYLVELAPSAEEGLARLEEKPFDLVVSDLKMPEMDGLQLLRTIKKARPEIEVILLTGYGTIETAVEAMKEGAYDFITKPVKRATILKTIEKALEKQLLSQENKYLRDQLVAETGYGKIVGRSYAVRQVLDMVDRVARLNTTVLILGDSGTGKELVARAIHERSDRKNRRFIPINCGALPDNLIESELFGHVRGAFTGAIRDKDGLFRAASSGTLFLDEITTVPESTQVKLLRALEEKEILPVGTTIPVNVDTRILAASNRDLSMLVEQGKFREDLYYRLNVVEVYVPPLRERAEDIPLLVDHFIRIHNADQKKSVRGVDPDALSMMMNYEWNGNVRELENVIQRAMILCDEDVITPRHLSISFSPTSRHTVPGPVGNLKGAVREFERAHIVTTLRETQFDKQQTAKRLGMSQSSLYRKLTELEINEAELT